ncbi:MAG TPA: hypothetical protein VGR74_18625 [Actinomycetota bacterium]|nr:hypothetical protein [Actinomycetota bacterium]
MHPRHLGRLLTVVLALALLGLLSSGSAALAVPGTDGGSVAPQPPCVSRAQLHLGHREQVDPDSVPNLCRPAASVPAFTPSVPARTQPARTTTARGVLVAVLLFVALLASLVAGGAWRRLRATRPREAT